MNENLPVLSDKQTCRQTDRQMVVRIEPSPKVAEEELSRVSVIVL